MKRTGYKMKRITAMILSACLAFSQGAVNVWAVEETVQNTTTENGQQYVATEVVETASASDAMAATASDAQFDEDGFLLDGEVVDDIVLSDTDIENELINESISRLISEVPEIAVTGVTLDRNSAELIKGEKITLLADVSPDDASDQDVIWSSSDETVATVSDDGEVTAVKSGTAEITVETEDGGYTDVCTVTVRTPITGLTINPAEKSIPIGKTFQLEAQLRPEGADDPGVIWTSGNETVAMVNSSGLVLALKAGSTYIYAKTADGRYSATCKVTVTIPVTSVNINATTLTLEPGKSFQLTASVQPGTASNKTVIWSSSDDSVVMVGKNGLIAAVKEGTAIITVTTEDGGYTATCTVMVGIPVTGININTTALDLIIGDSFQMEAWPQPSTAANKTVIWSSSDESVVTVDSTGLVTAVKKGTATVKVKTQDGGYTASCTVTVVIPVSSVIINITEKDLIVGKKFQMAAWPQPVDATDRSVTWSSSNTSVATVSADGLVKALNGGTTNIIARTVDGGYTAVCKIKVIVPVSYLKVNTTYVHIEKGETFQLKAWPQPVSATNRAVTWTSSDNSVATVDSTGLVTAVNYGTAYVTVKTIDGEYWKKCEIVVGTRVSSVSLNTQTLPIEPGHKSQMTATVYPTNASIRSVSWKSSNDSIVTVSNTGLVTAVQKGTATITVTTDDGGYSKTCTVYVGPRVTGINLDTTAKVIEAGQVFQLKAFIQPSTAAAFSGVSWTPVPVTSGH